VVAASVPRGRHHVRRRQNQAERFHVTVQFRANGLAVEGNWTDRAVALGKFRAWVGSHGSQDDVTIMLWEETGGARTPVQTWTKERGEEIHSAT
jgi:hypothetical protein